MKDCSRADEEVPVSGGPWASAGSKESSSINEQIQEVLDPLLRSLGLDLFEFSFTTSPRGGHLQVFLDKQDGVSVSECAKFSRLLGPALDVSELIPTNYTLEVSSPGLDRPLRKKSDYHRFTGRRVKIKTTQKIENQKVFIGKLVRFDDEIVVLLLDRKEEKNIPFDQILHARLEIEWPPKEIEEV